MAQIKKGKRVLFIELKSKLLSCSPLLSRDDTLILKIDEGRCIDREKLKK